MPELFPTNIPVPPENPTEKHVACVLLVDTSGSMAGNSINEVNEGIRAFKQSVMNDSNAKGVVDVCLITFSDSAAVSHPFCPIDAFEPPVLQAGGLTAMNQAILMGLDEIERRKQMYRDGATPYFRPWMFLLTDGYATDSNAEVQAKSALDNAINGRHAIFFPLGVEQADMSRLKEYSATKVFKLNGHDFQGAFEWLSASMVGVSNSNPGESKLNLPPTPGEIITIDL